MKYKAIISDIDGTLIPLVIDALPSKKVKKTIQKAEEKGALLCLATGKPYSLIENLISHLELDSYIIVDNGAAIYHTGAHNVVWQSVIDISLASKIVPIIKTYQKPFHVSCEVENFEGNEYAKNHPVRKFVVHGLTQEEATQLIKKIENEFPTLTCFRASAYEGASYIDVYITNADATKQHAILKFLELVGINQSETIGIGDHYNDFPLLMACGLKVAMGNAVPELKEIADYVAPSVEDDGVADVIEKFVLTPSSSRTAPLRGSKY